MARPVGRRRRPLTPARIYRTALRLARARGVEDLSMRKLAAALGVDAMSIYHHVPDKQALLLGVYQTVLAELPLPEADGAAWRASLRELGLRFYRLARKYPSVFPHLISSRYATPREIEIYHRVRAILEGAGFGTEEAARTTRAIYTYATGIALVAINAEHPRRLYQYGPRRAAAVPPAEPEADLIASIELILAGIEQRLGARRGRASARRATAARGRAGAGE